MYSKHSRYRALPDVVAVDARGRHVRSTHLRLPPEVDGIVEHTVEEVDRLDNLAHQYYQQPRHWWHICDANPQINAPQDLLGREPRETAVIPVTWTGERPPWSDGVRALMDRRGVQEVHLGSDEAPGPNLQWVDGSPVATLTEAGLLETLQGVEDALRTPETAAPVAAGTFAGQLGSAIAAAGRAVTPPVRIESTAPVRHTIVDAEGRRYEVRYVSEEGLAQVLAPRPQYEWEMQVAYNTIDQSPDGLAAAVEGIGFSTGLPSRKRRLGKAVAIPPRPQL
jgi:hypothetical protein